MNRVAQQAPHINLRRLRSKPGGVGVSAQQIDVDAGVLYDVVMVQEGPAVGHGVELDAGFVENLVAYDRKYFSKIGLKARFGHPSMSSEAMGTQLGVFRNFRKREKDGKMQGIADLFLLDSSEKSPTHPGMRSWVLDMAAERPDFLMSSIVFKSAYYYQRKGNGNRKRMEFDELGDITNYDPELGPIYAAFEEEEGAAHYFTDLVEDGAVTDNLFAANTFSPHLFVSQVHEFLDEHPHIQQFITGHPEKAVGFLQRLGIPLTAPTIMEKQEQKTANTFAAFFSNLFGKNEAPEQQFAKNLDDLVARLAAVEEANTVLQSKIAAYETEVTALKTALEAANTRLATVEKTPADVPTGADTPPAEGWGASKWKIDVPEAEAYAGRKKMPGLK